MFGIRLKRRTGSRGFIGLLHCVSYDSVLRAETAIATNRVVIPAGFSKGKLITLVFDNIDFIEETLHGAGTIHQMNGIMFQDNDTAVGSISDSGRVQHQISSLGSHQKTAIEYTISTK